MTALCGPFHDANPLVPPPPPSARTEADDLPLTALQRLQQLEADFAQLRLEWSDTLDRIQRWAGRMAARERQRIHRDLDQLGGDSASPEAAGEPNGNGGGVDPRQSLKAQLRARAAQMRGRRLG